MVENKELKEEDYEDIEQEVENFNNSFLSYLAGTANYEIVPTQTDDGRPLRKEHYEMIKKECSKIGSKILYTYLVGSTTIVINPKNMKTAIIHEGEYH